MLEQVHDDEPRPLATTRSVQLRSLRASVSQGSPREMIPLKPDPLQDHLSKLPPELGVKIFQNLDGFATAKALILTSRFFRTIWDLHIWSIGNEFIAHRTPCCDYAIELLAAQMAYPHSQRHREASLPPSEAKRAIIGRVNLLRVNASIADSAAWRFRPSKFKDGRRISFELTPNERVRFTPVWYGLLSIATLAQEQKPLHLDILSTMDFFDFFQLQDVSVWCWHTIFSVHPPFSALDRYHHVVDSVFWRLNALMAALKTTPAIQGLRLVAQPQGLRIRDEFEEMHGESHGRGIQLRELLPLIRGPTYDNFLHHCFAGLQPPDRLAWGNDWWLWAQVRREELWRQNMERRLDIDTGYFHVS